MPSHSQATTRVVSLCCPRAVGLGSAQACSHAAPPSRSLWHFTSLRRVVVVVVKEVEEDDEEGDWASAAAGERWFARLVCGLLRLETRSWAIIMIWKDFGE